MEMEAQLGGVVMGVSAEPRSRPQALKAWVQSEGKDILLSEDFISGTVAACLAFVAAFTSDLIRDNGTSFLAAMAALGVALAAIVVTVLAILVSLFDDNYRRVLQSTPSGTKGAFRPYRVVGAVGVSTSIVAFLGLFVWPVAPMLLQSVLLAVSGGLGIWALVGTWQLIGLTAFHGETRIDFLAAIDEARQELTRRRQKRNAG